MRIYRVRMRNFRCFGEGNGNGWGFTYQPKEHLNLLVGPNGSGKTTLIDAIDLVLNPEGRSNRALVREYDFPHSNTSKPIVIEITLIDIGDVVPAFDSDIQWLDPGSGEFAETQGIEPNDGTHVRALAVSFSACFDSEDGELKWRWFLPKFPETDLDEARDLTRRQHDLFGFFRIRPAISAGAMTLGEYSTLGRHLRRLGYKLGRLPDRLRPQTVMPECLLQHLDCKDCPDKGRCSPITEAEDQCDPAITLGATLSGIASNAANILGARAWANQVPSLGPRYGGLRSHLAAVTLGVVSENRTHPNFFLPFERLSAGERYSLSFAIATTQIPGESCPILVMEEPETALYPSAVARILATLMGQRNGSRPQVLVTTHSESALRAFSARNIFIMGRGKSPESLDAAITSQGPHVQTTHLSLAIDCLIMPGGPSALFAEKLLIVEGAGDAIVSGHLDRLAATVCPVGSPDVKPFALEGWCVLAGAGTKSIPPAVEIFKKLGKDVVALLDGDDPGKAAAEALKHECPVFVYSSNDESHPTLEDALLLGLPRNEQKVALTAFYDHPSCKTCKKNDRRAKCWHQNRCSDDSSRPCHKADLQTACISQYAELSQYPPAFAELLTRIDAATTGQVMTLTVDASTTP